MKINLLTTLLPTAKEFIDIEIFTGIYSVMVLVDICKNIAQY